MKRYMFDELDKVAAVFGLIVSLVSTIWLYLSLARPTYTAVGVFSFLACSAYLVFRKSFTQSMLDSLVNTETSSKVYLALNVIFFTLFAYSILCLNLRPEPYTRPLGYFIATALMASVAGVEILFLPSRKRARSNLLKTKKLVE